MTGATNLSSSGSWMQYFEWAYSGVDFSLPGNGGQDCVDFIPVSQRALESLFFAFIGALEMSWAWPRLKLPEKLPATERVDRLGKRLLLVTMCLTYGIELGFKFASNQIIFIFNPCHMTTMIQIFLLMAPPSRLVMAVYRMHMHMLSGAVIAIILPVINTRMLTFETEIYFIQHFLILVIPYYLMRVGGVYVPEALTDYSWCLFTIGWLFFYHFLPLSGVAMVTKVNLNNMMCPAVSDPFYGRWYRLWGASHQTLVILVFGKIYTYIAYKFLPHRYEEALRVSGESNGHVKAH